ncbi:hypothetical protein CGZ75_20675 [Paenibacillus herberti]|uniref:Beta-galactosidase trimerisation domain-containing protein n=2 Tax=Paenibacillus herberti TaxID=1619309 RepID=A0A229NUA7_9BACL|nr:beta-galactosidase trimerization domain-containing protein [Paenibacillus herberti]OXM13461.1 hypothetical protein CGZ75_20675 [Paenibacillus herberti]
MRRSGPTVALDYVNEVHKYYDALSKQHVAADMIGVEENFSRYEVIVAPVMYMVKPSFAQRVEQFVKNGGTFITTFFSGIVNENDLEQRNRIVMTAPWSGLEGTGADAAELADYTAADAALETAPSSETTEYGCGLLCNLIHAGSAALRRWCWLHPSSLNLQYVSRTVCVISSCSTMRRRKDGQSWMPQLSQQIC